MTLVISSIVDGKIEILSDTLISYEASLGKKPDQALKLLALSPTIMMAYSGAHDRALSIYYQLCDIHIASLGVEAVLRALVALRTSDEFGSKDGQVPPDFLLASTEPNPIVYRITELGVSTGDRLWIGNGQAVVRVMANEPEMGYERAMEHVINDPIFEDVGGCLVKCKGTSMGFGFVQWMMLTSPRYVPDIGWSTVDWGTAETGGFAYTTVVPREPGISGFGVYFLQGRVGIFFRVDPAKRICEGIRLRAQDAEQFASVMGEEVGYALDCFGALGAASPGDSIANDRPMKVNEFPLPSNTSTPVQFDTFRPTHLQAIRLRRSLRRS